MVTLTEKDADFIIRYFRKRLEWYVSTRGRTGNNDEHDIVSKMLGALGPVGNILGEPVRNKLDDDIGMCERCIELLTAGSSDIGKDDP